MRTPMAQTLAGMPPSSAHTPTALGSGAATMEKSPRVARPQPAQILKTHGPIIAQSIGSVAMAMWIRQYTRRLPVIMPAIAVIVGGIANLQGSVVLMLSIIAMVVGSFLSAMIARSII